MSRGRLGPASGAPSCWRRRKDASPPGPDSSAAAWPMIARSSASRAGEAPGPAAGTAAGAAGPAPGSGSGWPWPATWSSRHHRRAFRRQVAVHDPGAVERGLQPQRPVLEVLIRAVIGGIGPGPGVDLRGQLGQVRQGRPGPRRPGSRPPPGGSPPAAGPTTGRSSARTTPTPPPPRPSPPPPADGRRRGGPIPYARPRRPW